MTTSELLIARVLSATAGQLDGPARLAVAELIDEYRTAVALGLKAEETIHRLTKGEA